VPRVRDPRVVPDEGEWVASALAAGCDLVLAPADLTGALEAIDAALDARRLDEEALTLSRRRRDFWADWALPRESRETTLEELLWARQLADTVAHPVRGILPNIGPVVDVSLVDDDADADGEEPRGEPFVATLRALGLDPRVGDGVSADGRGALVIALFGEPGIGRGRAGYHEGTRRRVAQLVASARQAQRASVVVQFGPPRLAGEVPEAPNLLCCWSGHRAMQEAAARRLR
jgi:hypothetical protein